MCVCLLICNDDYSIEILFCLIQYYFYTMVLVILMQLNTMCGYNYWQYY